MLRTLIQKLPKLSSINNDIAGTSVKHSRRNCRSLSPPVQHKGTSNKKMGVVTTSEVDFGRSISCSRTPRGCSMAQIQENIQSRKLCFSKDYYANNKPEPQEEEELHWRENPTREPEATELNPSDRPSDNFPMETLEQYELEAARPRPVKSHGLMEAFNSKLDSADPHCHLQPNQMKPYGSSENYYSPVLMRPTNSLKFPRKFKKRVVKDDVNNNNNVQKPDSKSSLPSGTRSFCTASCFANNIEETTTKKQDKLSRKMPSFNQLRKGNFYSDYWHNISEEKKMEFLPPKFPTSFINVMEDHDGEIVESSTPAMRRQRAEEENRRGSRNYKLCYSDLIKIKMQKKLQNAEIVTSSEQNSGCLLKNNGNKMLDAFRNLPGKRSMSTRSKTTLSSSKSGNKKSKNKPSKCEDVCTETIRLVDGFKPRKIPYEPKKCEPPRDHLSRKVFLPSKVRLPVPPSCSQRPEYRDCKKITICDVERADDCAELKYKPLPKLEPGNCVCIDQPQPTYAPKLQKLQMKFEDPPRPVCHVLPCQTPRADDSNPQRFKKLKPHKPQDCACVEPPPMIDIKLKRLIPKCEPEEVCRPVRKCPEPHQCPPRADENLKILPKKLPHIEDAVCPCVEIPPPTVAPPIKRLDLSVPDPERACQKKLLCADKERADDSFSSKKKKLPKFVPGDCPCEDRPMVDWNLKRLVCDEVVRDCEVPDPCNTFPRADWGCWEYEQEECREVDEKCIEKPKEKCNPPPCEKLRVCKGKKKVCGTWTTSDMNNHDHKRRFSITSINLVPIRESNESTRKHSSSSVQQKVSNSNIFEYKFKLLKSDNNNDKHSRRHKKNKSFSLLNLIEVLNDIDKPVDKRIDPLLFKTEKRDRINFDGILKSIATTTPQIEKKASKNEAPMPRKKAGITVSSRAISTTRNVSEIDIRKKKDNEAKAKCKQIKPTIKALMCQKTCPRYSVCREKGREHRPACKIERVPVCCSKDESPHSAYSDNLPTTIRPFVTETPQFNCSRSRYGYYPNFKKEFEPLMDDHKPDKKNFCTSSVYKVGQESSRQLSYKPNPAQQLILMKRSRGSTTGTSSKGFLKTKRRKLPTQNRSFTTKIFQIHRPVCPKKTKSSIECPVESRDKRRAPKIVCHISEDCTASERRRCCFFDYRPGNQKRLRPPFPSFSDCLDEEMEAILTECPLDKEKYLRMQPRFMSPTPKPFTLKPPPPSQGKIDILKEQKCIRDKLCMENKGFTQTCTNFGKPVPLMKSKKMFPEVNWDCERIEELKRIGRWPPFTLKSTRRFSTSAFDQARNFHVLSEGIDKIIFKGNNDKDKLRLKKNKLDENAVPCIKLFVEETKQKESSNVAKRVQRFYTTYKINKRRSFGFNRRQLSSKPHRGNRPTFKTKKNQPQPKFTLKGEKRTAIRPISPYPAKLAYVNAPERINHFPNQENLNRNVAWEYYKCKHGIVNKGVTIGCRSVKNSTTVEVLLQDHQAANVCSQTPQQKENCAKKEDPCDKDREKLEAMCIEECIKQMPCHLPEEEKYCVCKERCEAYFRRKDSDYGFSRCPEEDVVCNSKLIDCEPEEKFEEEKCEDEQKKIEPCDNKMVCVPQKPPKEEVDCEKSQETSKIKYPSKFAVCEPPECKPKLKQVECIAAPPPCHQVVVKPAPCAKKPTQLESIWQRIVNFFKARPNCPEPGEYRKKVLRDKAEKAANALGLVVVDPKCLPQEMLRGLKVPKKDCKACPDQKRSFSTIFQQSMREYSNRSCKNLEEINRMLEEDERNKKNEQRTMLAIFPEKRNALAIEALKMSMDFEVYNYSDSEWCSGEYPNDYFGYSDVIPSRENVLERAWRISIERNNYPISYSYFNEIFTKVERSVKTYEDLEKLKTENILRELDQLLNKEANKKKK